jgi:hypothetical protein
MQYQQGADRPYLSAGSFDPAARPLNQSGPGVCAFCKTNHHILQQNVTAQVDRLKAEGF